MGDLEKLDGLVVLAIRAKLQNRLREIRDLRYYLALSAAGRFPIDAKAPLSIKLALAGFEADLRDVFDHHEEKLSRVLKEAGLL